MRGNCFNSTEKLKTQCCRGDARKGLKEKTKKELRHGLQKTEVPVQGSRWEASPGRLLFSRHEHCQCGQEQDAEGYRWDSWNYKKKHLLILGKKIFKYKKRNDSIALLVSVVKEGDSVWIKCKRIPFSPCRVKSQQRMHKSETLFSLKNYDH